MSFYTTFYDEWLATGDRIQERIDRSPMVARDRDVPWTRTRQDAKVKIMVANELGFPTMGGVLLKAEIPVGWHTGKHSHGEEAMHVLSGEGFTVIDGHRFDWHTGTTLQIPYRAVHQHFNTGSEPAQYLSALAFPLEAFVHLAKLEQVEDCGPNEPAVLTAIPAEKSQYLENGQRVSIHLEDAPNDPGDDEHSKLASNQNQHGKVYYLAVGRNGFKKGYKDRTVAITHIFEEPPFHHGGRHKHLEAMIYVLEGEGHSDVQGVQQEWGPGDVLHVPPAMYEHEHYNESEKPSRQLRIQFGIRFWFTDMWPAGYLPQRIYDEHGQPIIAGAIERVRERI